MLNVTEKGKLIVDWNESNFYLSEFVPEDLFKYYGLKCLWFLDVEHIKSVQFVRTYFGKPMLVNNWFEGGRFNYRGFRTDAFYYKYVGAKKYEKKRKGLLSQHRFGRATDFNLTGIKPNEIRKEMLENQQIFVDAGVTTIEDGAFSPTWCHIDSRNTNMDSLLIVKP